MTASHQLPFQDISVDVFLAKYAKEGETTIPELRRRVARALAANESDPDFWEAVFLDNMENGFVPAGRINSAAGTNIKATLINCFVQPIADTMADVDAVTNKPGITQALKQAAETLRRGGGVGYNFSHLRPKGGWVSGTDSRSSGPVSFMRMFDRMCETVESAGARRGAQMGVLRCDHPDIELFIHAKDAGDLTNFNISVGVTDAFMQAVDADGDVELAHMARPHDDLIQTQGCYQREDGLWVYKKVRARDLWNQIMEATYDHAEPGILFLDRMNQENNLWYCETIEATNPCVTGDTRLATQYGMVRVDELHRRGVELEVTVDNRALQIGERGTTTRPAVPVFITNRDAKVYCVTTKDGYEIKATEWHDFYTTRGKIKLKDLNVGDEILIQSGEGQFGSRGFQTLGQLLGVLAGDGHFTNRGKGQVAACVGLWGYKAKMVEPLLDVINEIVNTNGGKRKIGAVSMEDRDMLSIRSVQLADTLNTLYGFNAETKLTVPDVVWEGRRECVVGYLQGLFETDGTVMTSESSNTCSVRLTSVSEGFLKDVQILLSNFGIFSRIRMSRAAGVRSMPDGAGGVKDYDCQATYELIVDGESRNVFAREVGFILEDKQAKLLGWMEGKALVKTQSFISEIVSIEYCGREVVYDTTQMDNNTVIFNGIVTGQCAEQPLPDYGCCDLGSLNLTCFVRNAFTPRSEFDWDGFGKAVATSVRMLDNVLDVTYWPLHEQRVESANKRRIGLGFLGLGDALIMLGISYNSREGLAMAARISEVMRDEAYRASIELAKEFGPFPLFDADKYLESGFAKRLPESIRNDIRTYGIRNSHLLSIAPTGTITLAFADNASNGIEPAFSWSYARKKREDDGSFREFLVLDHAYRLYCHLYNDGNALPYDQLPPEFVDALSMSAADHMRMLEAVQPFIDTSISKTVNVPADYPYDDFKDLYLNGWKAGLKGLATYRPNNVLGAVLSVAEVPKIEASRSEVPDAMIPAGQLKDIDPLTLNFPSRPAGDLDAVTRKMIYHTLEGEKKIYLSVSFMRVEGIVDGEDVVIERPIEFFVPAGQRDDSQQWVAAAMRLLSQIARSGASVADALCDMREVIWDKGLVRYGRIERPDGSFGVRHHESEVAALAYALQEILRERGFLDDGFNTKSVNELVTALYPTVRVELDPNDPDPTRTVELMVSAYRKGAVITPVASNAAVIPGTKCPECGEYAVIKVDGCKKCTSCGHIGACG